MSAWSATVLGDATTRGAPIAHIHMRSVITVMATILAMVVATILAMVLATDITADRVSELVSARSASAFGNPQTSSNNFGPAARGLFKWAKTAQHISIDPTAGVSNPKRKKGPGFPVWTEEDVERYYARWPLGSKERVWIDVLSLTGGRRSDAVVIGRQHVRDGMATFRPEKSQGQIVVSIPILPVLQRTLDAGPIGELAFICGKNGKPFKKESFGNVFKEALHKGAGWLLNKSAHGCRKIWRDQGSRERRDSGRAQRDLRLDGYRDGLSLHRGGGSQAARTRLNAQDGERN